MRVGFLHSYSMQFLRISNSEQVALSTLQLFIPVILPIKVSEIRRLNEDSAKYSMQANLQVNPVTNSKHVISSQTL